MKSVASRSIYVSRLPRLQPSDIWFFDFSFDPQYNTILYYSSFHLLVKVAPILVTFVLLLWAGIVKVRVYRRSNYRITAYLILPRLHSLHAFAQYWLVATPLTKSDWII